MSAVTHQQAHAGLVLYSKDLAVPVIIAGAIMKFHAYLIAIPGALPADAQLPALAAILAELATPMAL